MPQTRMSDCLQAAVWIVQKYSKDSKAKIEQNSEVRKPEKDK